MTIPLQHLEQLDRELAPKCKIDHDKLDEGIGAITQAILLTAMRPELSETLIKQSAPDIAKKLDPIFVLRLLIAAKRGLVKKESREAADEVLGKIGKDPEPPA